MVSFLLSCFSSRFPRRFCYGSKPLGYLHVVALRNGKKAYSDKEFLVEKEAVFFLILP